MAHKNRNTTIPPTFDIRKYDVCKNFGWQEWYTNLMLRTMRLDMMRAGGYFVDELKGGHVRWLETPIVDPHEIKEGDGYSKEVYRSQVNDTSAYDFLTASFALPLESPGNPYCKAVELVRQDIQENNPDLATMQAAFRVLNVPMWKFETDMGYNHSGVVHATIDLFASEEKLVDDFKRWLRDTRTTLGVPNLKRRFTPADRAEWHGYRVLAYLDLSYLAELFKLPLTQYQIGIALFPDEYEVNPADRIRKVVSPLALSLATIPTLDALFSQLLEEREKAERNLKSSDLLAPE